VRRVGPWTGFGTSKPIRAKQDSGDRKVWESGLARSLRRIATRPLCLRDPHTVSPTYRRSSRADGRYPAFAYHWSLDPCQGSGSPGRASRARSGLYAGCPSRREGKSRVSSEFPPGAHSRFTAPPPRRTFSVVLREIRDPEDRRTFFIQAVWTGGIQDTAATAGPAASLRRQPGLDGLRGGGFAPPLFFARRPTSEVS
jgi:hypothetical protein